MTTATSVPAIPPAHPARSLLGHARGFRQDPLALILGAAQQHGDVVRLRVMHRTLTLLRHPDHIRHVLATNAKNYSKQTRGYTELRKLLGQGLVTSEGSFWLRQRRIAQPAFHKKKIAGFAQSIVELTEQMLARWDQLPAGGRIDASEEMMTLTLQIAARTLLSADVTTETGVIGRAVTELLGQLMKRSTDAFTLPLGIPTEKNRRFLRSREALDKVVMDLIAERRASGARPEDLLTMLLEARDDETGEGMTDLQLRDEVMTLFVAGNETTTQALSWAWYLLSQHPHVADRLAAELRSALGGRAPTFDDLPRLGYAGQVIQEAMRLYPPLWVLVRHVDSDEVVGGYLLKKGSFVLASPYVTHRDPRFFPDPETFDPDRFLPEPAARLPRFAYFPFSGGPHQCIGNTFAMMEAQLLLATVAQRYALDLVPGHPVEVYPTFTLRPRHGLAMHLRRRDA